ncbi:hypothetical protein IWX86_001503 [Polaromonas sp. CG_9.2]|jgi:hypothetical protein|nr:hypothetical protein [Polaromonas sp. CG_9.2]MDH6184351.1 hypothetical protein [Polaromonas sp. CG_23.6]
MLGHWLNCDDALLRSTESGAHFQALSQSPLIIGTDSDFAVDAKTGFFMFIDHFGLWPNQDGRRQLWF